MSVELLVRPISVWPGAATQSYDVRRSPFRSTWSKTVTLLEREIELAAGRYRHTQAVLEAFVRESDIRQDGWIRAAVTPSKPGVILNFTHKDQGALRFPCDRFNDWQDNVRAIALALESLRQVERYGIVRKGEQYAGWKALPAKETGASTTAILNSRDHAERCWRIARNNAHPDKGGSSERFHLVDAAWQMLAKHFGVAA